MTVFCKAGIQEQTARSQHLLVRGKGDVDINVLSYESVGNAGFTNKPRILFSVTPKEFLLAAVIATPA